MITHLSHATFAAGMHTAFLVGAAVALAGAILALVIRPGNGAAEAHPATYPGHGPDQPHSQLPFPDGNTPQAAFLQAVLWFLLPFTLSSPWPPGSPSMAHSSS